MIKHFTKITKIKCSTWYPGKKNHLGAWWNPCDCQKKTLHDTLSSHGTNGKIHPCSPFYTKPHQVKTVGPKNPKHPYLGTFQILACKKCLAAKCWIINNFEKESYEEFLIFTFLTFFLYLYACEDLFKKKFKSMVRCVIIETCDIHMCVWALRIESEVRADVRLRVKHLKCFCVWYVQETRL